MMAEAHNIKHKTTPHNDECNIVKCIHFDPSLLHIVHVGINTYCMYAYSVFCIYRDIYLYQSCDM